MTAPLPREVRSLVARHLHSVGEIDLLLLLRDDPKRAWSAEEICATLNCPPSWAALQLDRLRDAGLVVEEDSGWRFAPADPELGRATGALAAAYRRRKAEVVRLVFAPRSRSR